MKEYTDQDFLDIVDSMPEDQKRCSVNTAEDGTGTVELGTFIVNYGRTLLQKFNEDTGVVQ